MNYKRDSCQTLDDQYFDQNLREIELKNYIGYSAASFKYASPSS